MSSPTGCQTTKRAAAFTLIELILVMAVLIIVVSLVTPQLRGFFSGRSLDSESRQVYSLIGYGQSRAVSEGIPMFLWVNPEKGAYGLRQETGYADSDDKALEYTVADGLKLNVRQGRAKLPLTAKYFGVHFSPDGNIITGSSVEGISIQEGQNAPVWITRPDNGQSYSIENGILGNAQH
jgi:Tfp pilus assembly protein FimT